MRRLQHLEKRFGTVEDTQGDALSALLAAKRLKCGLPPISAERQAALKGLRIVDILLAGRARARLAGNSAEPGRTPVDSREQRKAEGKRQ